MSGPQSMAVKEVRPVFGLLPFRRGARGLGSVVFLLRYKITISENAQELQPLSAGQTDSPQSPFSRLCAVQLVGRGGLGQLVPAGNTAGN